MIGNLIQLLISFLGKLFTKKNVTPGTWRGNATGKIDTFEDTNISMPIELILQKTVKRPGMKWACAFTDLTMLFIFKRKSPLDINTFYDECVKAGAIKNDTAWISSYEKVAKVAGFPGLNYKIAPFDPNVVSQQLKNQNPVVIYLYNAQNEMRHVELAVGQKIEDGKFDFEMRDPGWAGHTGMEAATGKAFAVDANGKRIYNDRTCKKIGYYL